MKTAISIPDPLFTAAEEFAKRLGISRSELFQRAVRSFLSQHKNDRITEALDAVYVSQPASSELDPLLGALQSTSLDKEDWG